MLVLVGNETISAQTYQTRIDCGSPNCEIVIDFTINVIDSSDTICGRWYLEADYSVTSDPCNKLVSIQDFYWKNITSTAVGAELFGETVHGQSGFYQFPYEGEFDMQLGFQVTTNCSGTQTETYTHNFEITAVDSCGWCSSSFCLHTMTCDDGDYDWRVDFCTDFKLWNGVKSKSLYPNQNFDFPYIFYQTWPCQFNYPTYLDLVENMNQYFNGDPSGYAVIKYIEIGDPDWDSTYLCKIKFILRSSDYVIRELALRSNEIDTTYHCYLEPNYYCYESVTIFDYDNPQCLQGVGNETYSYYGESGFYNDHGILISDDQSVNEKHFEVEILPNFSNSQIRIKVKNKYESLTDLEILSVEGISLLKITQIGSNMYIPVDIHNLFPGTFLVRIVDQTTGEQIIKRIIKL